MCPFNYLGLVFPFMCCKKIQGLWPFHPYFFWAQESRDQTDCPVQLPCLYCAEVYFPIYFCGYVWKADVAWQSSNKVFVMERSDQAHNSGLHPKCRSSLFWPNFLTHVSLPKERPLEFINGAQRFDLYTFFFFLRASLSCYIFPHSFLSLGALKICTPSFAVKIRSSTCAAITGAF